MRSSLSTPHLPQTAVTGETSGDAQGDTRHSKNETPGRLSQFVAGAMRLLSLILVFPSMGTMKQSQGHVRKTYRIAISRNTEVLKPREPRPNGPEIYQQS